MENDIFSEVERQGARLGLPPDFYVRLLDEDDWSFVIKLDALVEAACSDALTSRLHAPELGPALATLDLGHSKHGKIRLLLALGALEKGQAAVLQTLYELRNKLAHNIGQVSFTFENHLTQLDKQQRASFIERAGYGIKPMVSGRSRELVVADNPKLSLWLTVSEILACLHLEHDVASARLSSLALQKMAVTTREEIAVVGLLGGLG
jgi:hypothetical protein